MSFVSCSICREIVVPNNNILTLHCGHLYHEFCVSEWMQQAQTCPVCRAHINQPPSQVYAHFEESESEKELVELRKTIQTLQQELVLHKDQENFMKHINQQLQLKIATLENECFNSSSIIKDLQEQLKDAELDASTDKYFKYLFQGQKDDANRKLEIIQHNLKVISNRLNTD